MSGFNWVTTYKNGTIICSNDNRIKDIAKSKRERYEDIENRTYDFFNNPTNPELKVRDGQIYMATSIVDALSKNENLIIEAGVGIGKSYAYLVPLFYNHLINHEKFIISTATIALQEQLLKDVENVSKMLHHHTSCVIAKGQTNFLCTQRAINYMKNHPDVTIDLEKQDRKEQADLKEKDWKEVCVNKCSYARCPYFRECEFYDMRQQMKNNDIVICNHNLLAKDLEIDRKLLNEAGIIVCDEAHNLETKFRDNYTKQFSLKSLRKEIVTFLSLLKNVDFYDRIDDAFDTLDKEIKGMTDTAIKKLKEKDIDINDCDELDFEFTELFKAALDEIIELTESIYIDLVNMDNGYFSKYDQATNRLEEISDDLEMLRDFDSNIYWMSKFKNNYTINFVSKKISDIIRNELNQNIKFILTSATLSTEDNNYDYILNGIGMNEYEINVEESQASPYDYKNKSMLYLCNEIPNPHKKEAYLEALYKKIIDLIKLTNGRTLVLFTSKSDMKYVYNKIKKQFKDINVYIQNNSSSQEEIKEKFKNDTNSVLLSTGTFWEGIDIKGESLSSVIIARLPFPIVTPYLEYKKDSYESPEVGHEEVYVKEMLIKLKQGIGRLIRCEDDKGIISILDSRVCKKNYIEKINDTIKHPNMTKSYKELTKFVEENLTQEDTMKLTKKRK